MIDQRRVRGSKRSRRKRGRDEDGRAGEGEGGVGRGRGRKREERGRERLCCSCFVLFCLLRSSSQYNDTCGFQLTSREESETEQMELCTFR